MSRQPWHRYDHGLDRLSRRQVALRSCRTNPDGTWVSRPRGSRGRVWPHAMGSTHSAGRAPGTERPSALFDRATTWMLAHKVLLPGATTLERFVAKLRHRVDVRVWRVLASDISPPQQRRLEDLLRVPDEDAAGRGHVARHRAPARRRARGGAPRQAAALDYATGARPDAGGLPAPAPRTEAGDARSSRGTGPARCRDRGAGVLRGGCAAPRSPPWYWDDITPTARTGQLRVRVRASKANADGRREDLRLLAGAFARAVEDLRAATEPAAADRVVPLGPHQVNRRLQVLAAALGLEGVSSHSGRRGLASELVRRGASSPATLRPSPSRTEPSPGSSEGVDKGVGLVAHGGGAGRTRKGSISGTGASSGAGNARFYAIRNRPNRGLRASNQAEKERDRRPAGPSRRALSGAGARSAAAAIPESGSTRAARAGPPVRRVRFPHPFPPRVPTRFARKIHGNAARPGALGAVRRPRRVERLVHITRPAAGDVARNPGTRPGGVGHASHARTSRHLRACGEHSESSTSAREQG